MCRKAEGELSVSLHYARLTVMIIPEPPAVLLEMSGRLRSGGTVSKAPLFGFLLAVRAWLSERRAANPDIEVKFIVEGSVIVELDALSLETPTTAASSPEKNEKEPTSDE